VVGRSDQCRRGRWDRIRRGFVTICEFYSGGSPNLTLGATIVVSGGKKPPTTQANTMDTYEAAEQAVQAFKALRDGIPDKMWDKLCDNELIDTLLTTLMELETAVESEEE
jgi:hypothetical protein